MLTDRYGHADLPGVTPLDVSLSISSSKSALFQRALPGPDFHCPSRLDPLKKEPQVGGDLYSQFP